MNDNNYKILMDGKRCPYHKIGDINYGFGIVETPAVFIKNVILGGTKNIELKEPLIITIETDEIFKTIILSNNDFNILVYTNEDVETGICEVIDYFGALYKNYVECDISELTGDALILRKRLIEFIDN